MTEYKEFLKKSLLNNKYGIYGKILETYQRQMEYLRTPSLFRDWLADELGVAVEKINLNSLNSVLKRRRKKKLSAKQRQNSSAMTQNNHPQSDTDVFHFTKPSSDDKRPSRIKEL